MKKELPWWYVAVAASIIIAMLLILGTSFSILISFLVVWAFFALTLYLSAHWFFEKKQAKNRWNLNSYKGALLAAPPILLVLTVIPLFYLPYLNEIAGGILSLIIWAATLTGAFYYFYEVKKWFKAPTIALGLIIVMALFQELLLALYYALVI